jgi:uncharacterized RDD family membrane protein YckC
MKCPKCQYLNFEDTDRCRNCGYDLTLALDLAPPADAALGALAPAEGPLLDLPLEARPGAAPPSRSTRSAWSRSRTARLELPLFAGELADEALVRPIEPGPPRPPLSVRRSTPEVPRARPSGPRRSAMPMLALVPPGPSTGTERSTDTTPLPRVAASWPRRAAAGAFDALLLLAIDVAVVASLLKLCDLTVGEIRLIPPVPLVAFLLLLNGGYLVGFTMLGGRSLGKMVAGIRVVGLEGDRVRAGPALLRAAALLVGLASLGLGLVPALFGSERRTLHDRLARTRVVRV